jgi:metalloendopeptidase OMA1, mitochondrial
MIAFFRTSLPVFVALPILVLIAGHCVTTSETNRKQLLIVPESQMNALGEQSYREILAKEKVSKDKKMTERVVAIGRRIAVASGAKYKWEFNLIDSKQANAFCLPGGKIGVYTGILKVAKSNAGLAAVLGHEVAHATARHSGERVSQSLIVSGVLLSLDVALRDKKYKPGLMAALGIGAQFGVMLPFSRKHESEADAIGLRYMAKAGYEPRESVTLWQRMAKSGSSPPEILSTHPDPERRAKALESLLGTVKSSYDRSQKQATVELI